MNVLIIGSGGREHAFAWKCAQSSKVDHVFVAPGNAGTANEIKTSNVDLDILDIKKLIAFAKQKNVKLTIVGPEAPLAVGIVDQFHAEKLDCFGPCQEAAQLESSKSYSKAFMHRHGIPTANYMSFMNVASALNYLKQQTFPVVIKADGLAAGKGVVIANHLDDAEYTVREMLTGRAFGKAGQKVIIEEFLQGEEASFIVVSDGQHIIPFATSQDHKARDNGDQGPNTGGMGAYSPAPVVTPALSQKIMRTIIEPTIYGMRHEGVPYKGFLYAGVMIGDKGDVKVLEYNCRFGDPEAQPILMRLQTDIIDICQATIHGTLDSLMFTWRPETALTVVLASKGYPNTYRTGEVISGLSDNGNDNIKIFHAGTALQKNQTITNGGRVLTVCALGNTAQAAQKSAYKKIKTIHWDSMYYRTDIGYRAIQRENDE